MHAESAREQVRPCTCRALVGRAAGLGGRHAAASSHRQRVKGARPCSQRPHAPAPPRAPWPASPCPAAPAGTQPECVGVRRWMHEWPNLSGTTRQQKQRVGSALGSASQEPMDGVAAPAAAPAAALV